MPLDPVLGAVELVGVDEAVALLVGTDEVSDDVVVVVGVVVAETNRLRSEACSSIWIACAHIVMGPLTSVLVEFWRTVTLVLDPLGRRLRHPANVSESPLASS